MNWLHQKIDEVFVRMKKEELAMMVEDYFLLKASCERMIIHKKML